MLSRKENVVFNVWKLTFTLQVAITAHGPVSVAIDAAHKSLSFYSSGVYYEEKCNNNIDGLDHAVLAVGYGTENGQDYWLVKNSWNTTWGDQGYVKLAIVDGKGICGVQMGPLYPTANQ